MEVVFLGYSAIAKSDSEGWVGPRTIDVQAVILCAIVDLLFALKITHLFWWIEPLEKGHSWPTLTEIVSVVIIFMLQAEQHPICFCSALRFR